MSETAAQEAPQETPAEAPAAEAPAEAPAAEAPAESAAPSAPMPTDAPQEGRWGDWRKDMAGGKEDPMLDRYDSPVAVYEGLKALRSKMDSGEYTTKLPDNPTDEDLAKYRKDNGIPETADGYETTLPEGFVFGENDLEAVTQLKERLHSKNASPEIIQEAVGLYAEVLQNQSTQLAEQDTNDRQSFEDTLRNEWGPDYQKNINIMKNYLQGQSEEVQNTILNSRTNEGKAIMNDPNFARFMTNMVLEINPAASVVQMTGKDTISGVQDRLAELKSEMDSDYNTWRSEANKPKRDEYDKLLNAQAKIEVRK